MTETYFVLAREIIHDNKFSFYAIFLLACIFSYFMMISSDYERNFAGKSIPACFFFPKERAELYQLSTGFHFYVLGQTKLWIVQRKYFICS